MIGNIIGGLSRLALICLFIWALRDGLRQQDHLLIWGSLFVLATLLWCACSVLFTGLTLQRAIAVSRHPSRIEGSSEEEVLTGWHWAIPRWLPLAAFSSTLDSQPTHFVRNHGQLSERACFPRRRLQPILVRHFAVSDFLNIFTWRFWDERAVPLRILPVVNSSLGFAPPIGVVSGADLPDPYSAETGDRLDMRRYRHGDPLRLVLWSIYQRSGHLMVRAPEKAVSQHQRTGLYLLTGPTDQPAAKLARVLLEKDALGTGWRFGADGDNEWADDKDSALDMLAESGAEGAGVRVHQFLFNLVDDRFGKCLILLSPEPETRNHKLGLLAHGASMPRLGLEIWVVFDPPNVPARNTFPTVAGAEMHLIERKGAGFRMVAW